MKVSTKSWFYRQANWFNWDISNSLCVYFWQVVWAVLFRWLILPVFVTLIAAFILGVLPVAPGKIIRSLLHWEPGNTQLTKYLWTVGSGYLVLITGFALGFAYHYWKNFVRKDKPKKPENLVIAYIKAKKRKVCPIIEFTKE